MFRSGGIARGLILRSTSIAVALGCSALTLGSCSGQSVSANDGAQADGGASSGGRPSGGRGGQAGTGGRGGNAGGDAGGRSAAGGRGGETNEAGMLGAGAAGITGSGGQGGDTPSEGGEAGVGEAGAAPWGDNGYECQSSPAWSRQLVCERGFVHRPLPIRCDELPPDEPWPPGEGFDGEWGECGRDVDCPAGSHCIFDPTDSPEFRPICHPACQVDADCDAGFVCSCEPVQKAVDFAHVTIGTCRAADCTMDDDCAPGQLCGSPLRNDCGTRPYYPPSFRCQSPLDECTRNADCGERWPDTCVFETDHFACTYNEWCELELD